MYKLLLLLFLPVCLQSQSFEDKLQTHRTYANDELVYIHTSQSFYEPGNKIYGTVWAFNPDDKSHESVSRTMTLYLLDPSSKVIDSANIDVFKGSGSFTFKLPELSGVFSLKVKSASGKTFFGKPFLYKTIQVQSSVSSNLNINIRLDKTLYKPGDTAAVDIKLNSVSESFPAYAKIHYALLLDGHEQLKGDLTSDQFGMAFCKLVLPVSSQYSSAIVVADAAFQGITANAMKVVQLPGTGNSIEFFPEGGHLVDGIQNRVAFKVSDVNGSPKMVRGILVDNDSVLVAQISTRHEGMGLFEFTPLSSHHYKVILAGNGHQSDTFGILHKDVQAIALRLEQDRHGELKVSLQGHEQKSLKLYLRMGDRLIESRNFDLKDSLVMNFKLGPLPMGVLQCLVFDSDWKPVAERLVFVGHDKHLKVTYKFDQDKYQTDKYVRMKIKVSDEQGKPVRGALAAVAVYREDLHQMSDPYAANSFSELYLSQELVNSVEHPAYYFRDRDEETLANLDLLMMCSKSVRVPYWALDSANAVLKSIFKKEQGYVIRGNFINGRIFQDMDFYRRITELRCVETGQLLAFDSAGNFTLIGIPEPMTVHFRVFCPGQHGYIFQSEPWLVNVDLRRINLVNWYNDFTYDSIRMAGSADSREDRKRHKSFQSKVTMGSQTEVSDTVKRAQSERGIRGVNEGDKLNQYGISGRGSRTDGTAVYIDGAKVNNSVLTETGGPLKHIVLEPSSACYTKSTYLELSRSGIRTPKMNTIVIYAPDYSDGIITNYMYNYGLSRDLNFKYYNPFEFVANTDGKGRFVDTSLFHYSYRTFNWEWVKAEDLLCYVHHVLTDSEGMATVEFSTALKSGLYRCNTFVSGHGKVAENDSLFAVTQTVLAEIKMPSKIWAGEKAVSMLQLVNTSDSIVNVLVKWQLAMESEMLDIQLKPFESKNIEIQLNGLVKRFNRYQVSVTTDRFNWKNEGTIMVDRPNNFHTYVFNASDKHKSSTFFLPAKYDQSVGLHAKVSMTIGSSQLIEIMSKELLREPHGCFEQVSSVNYPNILAYAYLLHSGKGRDEQLETYVSYIYQGYNKLVAYETSIGGFEWFGNTPPHEGLTAYGIMQFIEMKQLGLSVDEVMFKRVSNWLYSRFTNEGPIQLAVGNYDQFRNQNVMVATTYATFVLSHVKTFNLTKQINYIRDKVRKSYDPYQMALLAEIYRMHGDSSNWMFWVNELAGLCKRENFKLNCESTLTNSYGIGRTTELNSVVALSLIHSGRYEKEVEELIRRIMDGRTGKTFSSTQSTIWALKAFNEWMSSLHVQVQDKPVVLVVNRDTLRFDTNKSFEDEISCHLKPGLNNIEAYDIEDPSILFQFAVEWVNATDKLSSQQLNVDVRLNQARLELGQPLLLQVKIDNLAKTQLDQVVAVIKIPSGCMPLAEQLRIMKEKGEIDYFEIQNGEIHLYFRKFDPRESKTIFIPYTTTVMGTLIQPSVYAYPYYYREMQANSERVSFEVVAETKDSKSE